MTFWALEAVGICIAEIGLAQEGQLVQIGNAFDVVRRHALFFHLCTIVGLGAVNASGEDIESTTLETGEKKGSDELDKIQSEELKEEHDIYNKIYEAIADDKGNTVLKCLMSMCGATEDEEETSEEEEKAEPGTSLDGSQTPSTPGASNSNNNSSAGSSTSNNSNVSNNSSSSNISNSPTSSSTTNEITQLENASEMYSKIYEAIADGETVNVLTVLQEINDRLAEDRVFYTSMVATSSNTGTANSIIDTSAQIYPQQPDVEEDDSGYIGKPPHPHKGSSSSGKGLGALFTEEESSEALELIIATAVETALRSVAGYSSGSGLPVVVTNLNNYGGGF